jgi:hypothetical protein
VAQVVECLSSKYKALSANPSTAKKKKSNYFENGLRKNEKD